MSKGGNGKGASYKVGLCGGVELLLGGLSGLVICERVSGSLVMDFADLLGDKVPSSTAFTSMVCV